MGDKGGRVFRNYKGHMNKTKREWKQGRELGMAAVVGRKCRQLQMNNKVTYKIIIKIFKK